MIQGLLFVLLAPFLGSWYGRKSFDWLRARGWSKGRELVVCYGGCIVVCGVLRVGIWALFW